MIAMMAIAELHKTYSDAWAIWYDAEMSFDKDYALKLGVDIKRLWIIPTNKPSEIFDHFAEDVNAMIQEGFPCKMLVIDSIKMIQGPKEAGLESIEGNVIGDLSMLLGKAFRKIIPIIRKEKVLTILVQQVSEEMDQIKRMQHIKWHVPCGQALKHASDIMLFCERVDSKASKIYDETHKNIQSMSIQIGHTVRCKIDKSRVGMPHLTAEFRIQYGVGIVDRALEVATLAMELGIITKPNALSYSFKNHKVTGFEKLVKKVESEPELYKELVIAINEFKDFSNGASEAEPSVME
jgi:RecA/RadA recombinase